MWGGVRAGGGVGRLLKVYFACGVGFGGND